MTTLNPNSRTHLLGYLPLFFPSLKFAVSASARLWRPIGVGALVVLLLALVPESFQNKIFGERSDWNWSNFARVFVFVAVGVTGFLVFYAKIWADAFSLLHDCRVALTWSFQEKEMAALRALRDVYLTAFVVGILPFLGLSAITAMPAWFFGGISDFENYETTKALTRTYLGVVLWAAIYARYFLALPTALSEAPLDREFPDICGRALGRIRPNLGAATALLVALAVIFAGLSGLLGLIESLVQNSVFIGLQTEDQNWMSRMFTLSVRLASYAIDVLSALTCIFVATTIWNRTKESGFDS